VPRVLVLSEATLRQIVSLDHSAIACIERAFAALATLPVRMPPILRLDIPDYRGEVDVKTAYVPGLEAFAIKISPGFFDNPKLGLPSVNGLMVLFSAYTGVVEALLLDNGYLTDLRTAAAGAIAAKYLSRPTSRVAAILGAGRQARLQREALMLVRPIERARIWARRVAAAEAAARDLSERLAIPCGAGLDTAHRRFGCRHYCHSDASNRTDCAIRVAVAGPTHHRDGIRCQAQK
jgi:ornithine cyclodeaminase